MQNTTSSTGREIELGDDQFIISRTDPNGKITYVNADFLEVSGYSENELLGRSHGIVRHPDTPDEVFADLWSDIKSGRPWRGVIRNRCKNGDAYWAQIQVAPAWEAGQVVGYFAIRQKASPEQVRRASALYAKMRAGELRDHVFRHGRAESRHWWARMVEAVSSWPIMYRFVALSSLAALLVLGGLTQFLRQELIQTLDNDARGRLEHQVHLVAAALRTHIQAARTEAIDHARSFSERVDLYVLKQSSDKAAAIERLAALPAAERMRIIDQLMHDLNSAGALFLRTPEGYRKVLGTFPDSDPALVNGGLLHADHPAITVLEAGANFVGYMRLLGRPYMVSYTPILNARGELLGASLIGLDLDERLRFLKSELRKLKLGNSGYYYVLDASQGPDFGELMLHPFREGTRVAMVGALSDRDIAREMLDKGRGEIRYAWMNPEAGETNAQEKLVYFETLSEPHWIVAGGSTVGEFTHLSDYVAKYLVIAGLSMVAVVFLIVLLLLRRLVFRPLDKEILPAFRAIASGGYDTRLNIRGEDEIARVNQGLTCMQLRLAFEAEQSRELAQAREVARLAAERLSQERTNFLANMSHEIRTPMNAVIGVAHLLSKSDLGQREQEFVRRIQSAGKLLLGVVNDILDFSKIDAGKLKLESADFCLDDVLDDLSVLVRERAQHKHLTLEYVVEPGLPRGYRGDALRVSQVLINLVGNAIKFTEQGSVTVFIERVSQRGDDIELGFRIQDTGIGMSPEQTQNLFKAFSQADSSITRRFGGTGLGLAISKRLIELMGGRIEVRSEVGVGSVFIFVIRLQVAAESQIAVPQASHRVLVVDDNPLARMVLTRLLFNNACEVRSVSSGIEAISELEESAKQPFDCVILDLNMPEMDGLTLAKRIRQQYGTALRLVLVTASNVHDEELVEMLDDFDAVLEKPVTASGISQALGRVLQAQSCGAATIASQEQGSPLAGLSVLVAEDVPTNQMIIRELLHSYGAQVALVDNGERALAHLAAHAAATDVVLMDIQMPVLDGLEATRIIRSGTVCRDIPVIALTAQALDEERERTLAAGMNDFVTKPIDPGQLLTVLGRWIPLRSDVTSPAPASPVQIAEPVPAFPDIPGVDVQDGLARMRFKTSLYERVLRDFHARISGETGRITAALDAGDWEGARRMAHSLKGLCATIGAGRLSQIARELEQSLQAQDANHLNLLEVLDEALHEVLAGIAEVVAIH